jgi:hypothetical protein
VFPDMSLNEMPPDTSAAAHFPGAAVELAEAFGAMARALAARAVTLTAMVAAATNFTGVLQSDERLLTPQTVAPAR